MSSNPFEHGYIARLLSGWGNSFHDFTLYTPARYASMEYVMGLRSSYMPLMDRYAPVVIRRVHLGGDSKRLYLSADMFPHMPYRSIRELEYDYRHDKITKDAYESGKRLLLGSTSFGVPMPYFVYLFRNNFPGFTIPVQIDPRSNDILAFVASPMSFTESDAINTVEKVIRNTLKSMYRILKHVRVMGYIPKYLIENPAILMNIAFLYATFLPFEILLRSETYERMLEVAFARSYARILYNASQAIYNYYMQAVLPHSIVTVEENPKLPGIPSYNAYGIYARSALIQNLAETTGQVNKDLPTFQNPFAATLKYLLENRATVRDILYVSVRDDAVRSYPDNTFSFVSALYQHFPDLVHMKEVAEGSSQLYDNEAYVTYLSSAEIRIAEYLLEQTFPYYVSSAQIESLYSAYAKYMDLLPRGSTKKVLTENTVYVDDKLTSLLYDKPDVEVS